MKKNRFYISLILMLIVCWVGYIFLIENEALIHTPHKIRNIGSFIWIIIIGLIGYWGLGEYANWISKLWVYFYSTGLTTLVIAGLLNWFVFEYSTNIKGGLASFKLFFESPVPFLLFSIIGKNQTKN